MFENFKPIGKKILVKPIEAEIKTSGGLYLAPSAETFCSRASVMAAGPKCEQVKIGDTVYLRKHSGSLTDEEYIIISEDEILGIL